MALRSQLTGELTGKWSDGNLRSAKQADGNACGAFVLLVGILYIIFYFSAIHSKDVCIFTILLNEFFLNFDLFS